MSGKSEELALLLCLSLAAVWFGYLTKRGMRLGMELTNTAVGFHRLFWNRTIRLDRIAEIRVEISHSEDGASYWHIARDSSARRLFWVASGIPDLDEFIAAMRSVTSGGGIAIPSDLGTSTLSKNINQS